MLTLNARGYNVRVADASLHLQVEGCYRIPFEIVGYSMKHTFYVIHGQQEDCIVGLDFLTIRDLTFSGKRRMLTMGGTRRRI